MSAVQAPSERPYPSYAWWVLIYELILIVGVFLVVAADTIQTYHAALSAYLAAGLAMLSVIINTIVYSSRGALQAASAGFILLAIVTVCLYFDTSFEITRHYA